MKDRKAVAEMLEKISDGKPVPLDVAAQFLPVLPEWEPFTRLRIRRKKTHIQVPAGHILVATDFSMEEIRVASRSET